MKTRGLALITLAFMILAFAPAAVGAESHGNAHRRSTAPPAPELQFEGTLTAVSATSITLHDSHSADVVLALTSTTVIRKGDHAIAPADLKVGDQVHAKAVVLNKVNTAVEIIVQAPEDHNETEIEGTITAASATSITVHDSHGADVVLALTSTTVIRKGDHLIAVADLKVGDHVYAKAVVLNKVNTAVEIIVQAPEDQLEIEGTITAASASSITVHDSHGADVILMLTPSTVIRKGDQTIAPADLKVGDHVYVKAVAQNMVNTAIEIIVQKPEGGVTATANGTVTAASGSQLTVHNEEYGDITVKTDASTIIRKQGTTIAVSDIHVGDGVNCLGTIVGDHTILAKQIEVRGDGSHHH